MATDPKTANAVKIMVEGALCIALSTALYFVKIFQMPQGGSISLTMLPLLIFALRNGGTQGIVVGTVAGILRLFLGAYIVHPIQALLDYPVACALVGLAGFFRHDIYLGIIIAMLANLFSYVLSGVVFFASYAPPGTNPWIYSIIYNAATVVPETLVCMVLIYLLWPRLKNIGK